MESCKMNLRDCRRSHIVVLHMRTMLSCICAIWLSFGAVTMAQENGKEAPTGTVVRTESGGKVVINSKSVTYNFNDRTAVFETDVSCSDANIMITCDQLSVFLTDENSVSRVEAEGDVVIRELGTAKKATSGKAVYDVGEDTVVLTDNPRLEEREQGFYTKGADRIVYYRKKQEFKAEGENMQIEFGIPSDKAGRAPDLFGGNDDGKQE